MLSSSVSHAMGFALLVEQNSIFLPTLSTCLQLNLFLPVAVDFLALSDC